MRETEEVEAGIAGRKKADAVWAKTDVDAEAEEGPGITEGDETESRAGEVAVSLAEGAGGTTTGHDCKDS